MSKSRKITCCHSLSATFKTSTPPPITSNTQTLNVIMYRSLAPKVENRHRNSKTRQHMTNDPEMMLRCQLKYAPDQHLSQSSLQNMNFQDKMRVYNSVFTGGFSQCLSTNTLRNEKLCFSFPRGPRMNNNGVTVFNIIVIFTVYF